VSLFFQKRRFIVNKKYYHFEAADFAGIEHVIISATG
jgi:hypothetical protein